MKPGDLSRPTPTQKKAVQSEKRPARSKVWVNPKSHFKNLCEQAWKRAEVPSPKFIEMSQIDMRTKGPPPPPKAKAVAAGASGTSIKSRGGRREG